ASKIKTGWAIFSIILNVIVIILSFMAMANPLVGAGVFVWTMALQFMFVGIAKLAAAFTPSQV
ncbi:MAG: hypothetical protein ACRCTA_05475, partial [Bacilli bacterium]